MRERGRTEALTERRRAESVAIGQAERKALATVTAAREKASAARAKEKRGVTEQRTREAAITERKKIPGGQTQVQKDIDAAKLVNLKKETAAAPGGGGIKEYRQWFSMGNKEAMRRIFANQPEKQSEIAILFKALEEGNNAAAAESEKRLTRAMSPEQYQEYLGNIKEFFSSPGVPKQMRDIYKQNVEEPADAISELPDAAEFNGQIATDQDTGKRYVSDGTKWTLTE